MTKRSPENINRALKAREKIAAERPDFRRSECNRFPRLGDKWRSSKGIRSKMRLKKKSRWPIVETGYRGPVISRGLNPLGKVEVLVSRKEDLESVDPSINVVRISGVVGRRKRLEIIQSAEGRQIEVVNVRPSEKAAGKEAESESQASISEDNDAKEKSNNGDEVEAEEKEGNTDES